MKRLTLIVVFIIIVGGVSIFFSSPLVRGSSPTHSLGFWIDERDMWSGVGLRWTAQQFVTNYFGTSPYPSAMLFATALTPDGPGAPTAMGEAQWLGQVASIAQSSGFNVKIIILFFVNLSGGTISGIADQTSLLQQYMSALGSHSNIYGAEYEVEYFGDTAAEEQSFYNIVTGAGYVDILNQGETSFYSGEPVLGYSTYPYFGGAIPGSISSNYIGVGYGETGAPSGSTPNPAWTQATVQAIVDKSPGNPFVFIYSGAGGSGQPAWELWNWSTLRQWIWSDPNYQSNFALSSGSGVTSTSTSSTSTTSSSKTGTSTTSSSSTTATSSIPSTTISSSSATTSSTSTTSKTTSTATSSVRTVTVTSTVTLVLGGSSTTMTVTDTRTVTSTVTVISSVSSQVTKTVTLSTSTPTTRTASRTLTTSTSSEGNSATGANPEGSSGAVVSEGGTLSIALGVAFASAGILASISIVYLDRKGVFFGGGRKAAFDLERFSDSSGEEEA